MPFTEQFTEYYHSIIKPVVAEAGLKAVRSDEIYTTHTIVHDIWNSICKARLVIADVTSKNANVNYELGLCHAIGVPTILIADKIEDVPFDYRHRRCILYDSKKIEWENRLQKVLKKTIEAAMFEKERDLPLPMPMIKSYPIFINTRVLEIFWLLSVSLTILFLLGVIDTSHTGASTLFVGAIVSLMGVSFTIIVLSYARKP